MKTIDPSHTTGEPSYGNVEPDSIRGEPSYGNLEPHSIRGEPSYGNLEPHSARGEPSYGNLEPHSIRGEPSYGNLEPSHVTGAPSYLRYVVTGTGVWLLATAVLHWLPGGIELDPRVTPTMAALALINCAIFTVCIYFVVRRLPAAHRLPACAALLMPAAFGDAVSMAFFADFFPRLNPDASGMFAALLLLTYGVILATGLVAGFPRRRQRKTAILGRAKGE